MLADVASAWRIKKAQEQGSKQLATVSPTYYQSAAQFTDTASSLRPMVPSVTCTDMADSSLVNYLSHVIYNKHRIHHRSEGAAISQAFWLCPGHPWVKTWLSILSISSADFFFVFFYVKMLHNPSTTSEKLSPWLFVTLWAQFTIVYGTAAYREGQNLRHLHQWSMDS